MKWIWICLLMIARSCGLAGRAASVAVQAGDILIVNHSDNSVYRINPVTGDQRKFGTFPGVSAVFSRSKAPGSIVARPSPS